MDHYKRMVITKVVEQGSMSAAGRLLDMSPSAISQQIRYLENHSGITFITPLDSKIDSNGRW